jgi:hypothetical protein
MQNVLQHRPILLVEIDDSLAKEIVEFEREGSPTSLDQSIVSNLEGAASRSFNELSEKSFLETYRGIHATVLGATRNRKKYIFGVPSVGYEEALLSLLDSSASIQEICSRNYDVDESQVRAILTSANPLFECRDGLWSLTWTNEMIEVEMERAVLAHFDSVAVRSKAWRGRIECGDEGKERFCIPWSNVWRREFLQASRILNRGRQSDEIAQRLLFRLRIGLSAIEMGIDAVRVLVCVSAPAMLLATALHRWWPESARPAVADLGHYVFLGEKGSFPAITNEGGIVIVQDVLDDGKITRRVIDDLRSQGKEVLFVLAFISLVDFQGDAAEGLSLLAAAGVPFGSLVAVPKPQQCSAPLPGEDDSFDYWVEPRSLRPEKLTTLRREFVQDRDVDLERRNEYLARLDSSSHGCLIMAGHFVYGLRHFTATVDIRRTLEGEIGDEIARWVADICEGAEHEEMAWERSEAKELRGDVTAVLMPLHSQIHYLWPKVENILAQRGRRQPMWLLEPALFTGSGPGYRLPLQFKHQISEAVRDMYNSEQASDKNHPIRLLILDDAIASGRTATTALSTILNEVREELNGKPVVTSGPIEWIRYFALLNQTDHASYVLWRNIYSLGDPPVQIMVEEYAPFMGVTVYTEGDCPVCQDRVRLRSLIRATEDFGGQGAWGWIKDRIRELTPIAVDGGEVRKPSSIELRRGLDVLVYRIGVQGVGRYKAIHIDTAIWRFYELMYLSYPPSGVLAALFEAWPSEAEADLTGEYERYRWAVYEWCIRNWRRVVSDSAGPAFCAEATKEVVGGTNLIERLLECLATRFDEEVIGELICMAIERLAKLEVGRVQGGRGADPDRIEGAVRLDTALQLFFFNVQRFDRERRARNPDVRSLEYQRLLDHLDQYAAPLDREGHSLLRNLHRSLMRPSRFAQPKWALEVIAESLFRGRSKERPYGSHKLLPKLLLNVLKGSPDAEDLRLLHGSLVLFLAALDDINPYADMGFSLKLGELRDLVGGVLSWLRLADDAREITELRRLDEELDLGGEFCARFREVFHGRVEDILGELAREAKNSVNLDFSIEMDGLEGARVLVHMQRLVLTLSNRLIDPALGREERHSSRLTVSRGENSYSGFLRFSLLTDFSGPDQAARLLAQSKNTKTEEELLRVFGVEFGEWTVPSDGLYRAENTIFIPAGFDDKKEVPR